MNHSEGISIAVPSPRLGVGERKLYSGFIHIGSCEFTWPKLLKGSPANKFPLQNCSVTDIFIKQKQTFQDLESYINVVHSSVLNRPADRQLTSEGQY